MALVDSLSSPSTKTELDFFTVPPTQVSIKRGFWDEINLTHPITNDGPFEFRVPADPNLIQMSKNYIYMQLRLVDNRPAGGGHGEANIAPINLIGKTLFRQVRLYLNNKLVYDSGDKYAYRAFLETELNYGTDAKSSHLQSAMYTPEAGPSIDTLDNKGFKTRAAYFKDGKVVEVMAPLHIDLFMQDRYLINFCELKLELYRNSNDFILQSPPKAENVTLAIDQMKWYVRKVEVLESVNLAIEQMLNTHTVKYPIRRVVMSSMYVGVSSQSTPLNTLYTGQIPRRLIIGCVDGDAYRGTITKTPFNFQTFTINEVKVTCGGQVYPAHPLRLDFANNKYIRAYDQLFEALDMARDNKGNAITRETFKHGHCLFAFDLTPDEDDSGHWDLIREGSTTVEISFSGQVQLTGVEVIVYAEFDNMILIDKNRNVFFDYSA